MCCEQPWPGCCGPSAASAGGGAELALAETEPGVQLSERGTVATHTRWSLVRLSTSRAGNHHTLQIRLYRASTEVIGY